MGTQQQSRMGAIDVLRGIAASWVVFYHVWNRFFPGVTTQLHAFQAPEKLSPGFLLTYPVFGYGYIGVTLFFVLSGFCIHWPQARSFANTGSDRLSLATFARNRFWRLYPAYFASLFLTAAVLGFLPTIRALTQHEAIPWDRFGFRDLIVNALFVQHFHRTSFAFNGVYWTLLYEVQFYACYPLLLWASRRLGFGKMLAALLAAELFFAFRPLSMPNLFITRYFEWCLGMCAAEFVASGRRDIPAVALACIGLACGITSTFAPQLFPLREIFLATGFCGLLLLALRGEASETATWFTTLIRSRPLVTVGLSSYSLYLIHVPMIDLLWSTCSLAMKYGRIPLWVARLVPIAGVPVIFCVAYAWYRLFEKPFIRSKPKTRVAIPQEPAAAGVN